MLTKKDSVKSETKTKSGKSQSQSSQKQGLFFGTHSPLVDAELPFTTFEKKFTQHTKVIVKYNVGFGNQLFIRGKGANLSWDKGILLKNTKADEWIWETDSTFQQLEFKILINDTIYEKDQNHHLNCGSLISFTPKF